MLFRSINKKCINLLIAGRVSEAKGQKEAILAIKELVLKGYKNVRLYIAGSGEIEKINNIIKDHKLEKYIKVLGFVENVNKLREKMYLELVCSKAEAFGRVTAEAMMHGVPVIGSNKGGTVDLIKNSFNGYLYEKNNYIDLADKIEYLIKNELRVKEMGENAERFAKNNFTVEQNAEKIKNTYSEIYKL